MARRRLGVGSGGKRSGGKEEGVVVEKWKPRLSMDSVTQDIAEKLSPALKESLAACALLDVVGSDLLARYSSTSSQYAAIPASETDSTVARGLSERLKKLSSSISTLSNARVGLCAAAYDGMEPFVRKLDIALSDAQLVGRARKAIQEYDTGDGGGGAIVVGRRRRRESEDGNGEGVRERKKRKGKRGQAIPMSSSSASTITGRRWTPARVVMRIAAGNRKATVGSGGKRVESEGGGGEGGRRGIATPLSHMDDDEAASEEPTYCLCDQVAFGEMIACDSPDCPIEWFHCACVGVAPGHGRPDKWLCPICSKAQGERQRLSTKKASSKSKSKSKSTSKSKPTSTAKGRALATRKSPKK